ncbi:multiple monosaccharide ABC transporter ATP-binding protein [Falsirhodobacter halotolerans]|uniref:multiple monosaccharide ABC transporter ATP-binding protein n=1 Tax=Falsirhodobacter halotolerans TaxID=1146892 RepID=UPI001FCF8352|nr:multiple monosaccharide ABC transporter ATP-binding protein [Falsirhodobacter halotolerans]MCJ8141098.1 ATP-binding cassette domain-containing protein [Falsirhodobacter halotolerans]
MTAILEMRGITKTFPGVKALDDVNLIVQPGEIHAICGENGAGKSTLMKVLSGVYPHGTYDGEILFEGAPMTFRGIRDSEDRGIIIIHQELALVPLLSIAENMFLGNEITTGGHIDWPETYKRSGDLLRKVGLREPPNIAVGKLGVGKQQLVEIAKALSKQVKLLILDEPTASLQENDSQTLLDLLLEFKAEGITSIIISHKLNEVRRVADRVTVLRDGNTVSTMDAPIEEEQIIRQMVGRDMNSRFPDRNPRIGQTLMEIECWSARHPEHADRMVVRDVSLHVKAGEIVGIAGLMGAGRTELAMSVFGQSYGHKTAGTVLMDGAAVDTSTVRRAIDAGLAYVTEDRKGLGLVMDDPILRNTTLAALQKVSSNMVLDRGMERHVAEEYRRSLHIRTPGVYQQVMNLSGGNQQKVVLAKWLFTDPKVLILDEPTRGIDVGAKFEIYTIINELAAQGRGVIVISSEMPELLGLCDRIYVMNEGAFVGELRREEASQERIMSMIVKGKEEHNDRVA